MRGVPEPAPSHLGDQSGCCWGICASRLQECLVGQEVAHLLQAALRAGEKEGLRCLGGGGRGR